MEFWDKDSFVAKHKSAIVSILATAIFLGLLYWNYVTPHTTPPIEYP